MINETVYGSLITATKCYHCIHFPLCFAQKGGVNLGLASENNCEYFQPKLPDDVILLTREELHEAEENAYQVGVATGKKVGGKETAREILKGMLDGEVGNKYPCKVMGIERYYEIAKKHGVEVNE